MFNSILWNQFLLNLHTNLFRCNTHAFLGHLGLSQKVRTNGIFLNFPKGFLVHKNAIFKYFKGIRITNINLGGKTLVLIYSFKIIYLVICFVAHKTLLKHSLSATIHVFPKFYLIRGVINAIILFLQIQIL